MLGWRSAALTRNPRRTARRSHRGTLRPLVEDLSFELPMNLMLLPWLAGAGGMIVWLGLSKDWPALAQKSI